MNEARVGHSLIFHENHKMVFAIGGTIDNKFSNSCEVYSIDGQKWHKLNDLKIERSRMTSFVHQDSIYVMGGLTTNAGLYDAMV